ncbi:MAG: hypothetical protein Q8K85_07725, partial [Hyphomicrobium sp.]|nr:hypothetical protein [Hyphomicrobium sp.]
DKALNGAGQHVCLYVYFCHDRNLRQKWHAVKAACRDFRQYSAAKLSAGAAVEYFAAHGPVLRLSLDALRIFRARTVTYPSLRRSEDGTALT